MTEEQIRQFVSQTLEITSDSVSVIEKITARWVKDREEAVDEGRDAVWDGALDSD